MNGNKARQSQDKPRGRSIVLAAWTHGLLPLAWFVFALFIAPHFVAVLKDVNTDLPVTGRVFVQISHFTGRFSVLVLGVLILGLLADMLIYRALARSTRPYLAGVWSLFIVLLEILVTGALFIATYVALLAVATAGL